MLRRFFSFFELSSRLSQLWDIETPRRAARILKRLAAVSGVLTTRCVDAELLRAMERLRDLRRSSTASKSRAAAVLVLRALADATPALVYAKRTELVRTIWNAVCDMRADVRADAILAFKSVMRVVASRDHSEAGGVVDELAGRIIAVLKAESPAPDSVHGCLLALGTLLDNSFAGKYLRPRFPDLCHVALGFENDRDPLVRGAVASVVPLLAASSPMQFAVGGFLEEAFCFLARVLRSEEASLEEQSAALVALGETALAVGGESFSRYLEDALVLVREALTPRPMAVVNGHQSMANLAPAAVKRKGRPGAHRRTRSIGEGAVSVKDLQHGIGTGGGKANGVAGGAVLDQAYGRKKKRADALACVGLLARAVSGRRDVGKGSVVRFGRRLHRLLPAMFSGELSEELVAALQSVVASEPRLLPAVLVRFLSAAVAVLAPGAAPIDANQSPSVSQSPSETNLHKRPSHANLSHMAAASSLASLRPSPSRMSSGSWHPRQGGNSGSIGYGRTGALNSSSSCLEVVSDSLRGVNGHLSASPSSSPANMLMMPHGSATLVVRGDGAVAPNAIRNGLLSANCSMASLSSAGMLNGASGTGDVPFLEGSPPRERSGYARTGSRGDLLSASAHGLGSNSDQRVPLTRQPSLASCRPDERIAGTGQGASESSLLLALSAVIKFDFSSLPAGYVCDFVRFAVLPHTDARSTAIRHAAVIASAHLLAAASDSAARAYDSAAVAQYGYARGAPTSDESGCVTGHQDQSGLLSPDGVAPRIVPLGGCASCCWTGTQLRRDVAELLSLLLSVAVADTDASIRLAALKGLDDSRFNVYLAQPESLRTQLLCLYDEKLAVKEQAVALAGHQAGCNPAHALPALRKLLMQLLVTLRCPGHALLHARAHAAKLLSLLIRYAPRLVTPYVRAILVALIARLRDARASGDTAAAGPVLTAVGDLAGGGTDLRPYLADLLPLVVASLQLESAQAEFRKAALRALSRLVQNTGCVVEPYRRFRALLPSLLRTLRFESDASVRLDIEILLGTLGAVDPDEFKYAALPSLAGTATTRRVSGMTSAPDEASVPEIGAALALSNVAAWGLGEADDPAGLPGSFVPPGGRAGGAAGVVAGAGPDAAPRGAPGPCGPGVLGGANGPGLAGGGPGNRPGSQLVWSRSELRTESLVGRLSHPFTANAEYFPSAALDALHRILADGRLSHYHCEAVGAVVQIIQSLDAKCVPFLPAVIPRLLWLLRPQVESTTVKFREVVFKRLGEVVTVARQHLRPHLSDILALIAHYWDAETELVCQVLMLVERLCRALGDEFRPLIPALLPPMLGALHADRTSERAVAEHVLRTLETFGNQLDDHVALTLPAVLVLACDASAVHGARLHALTTFSRLVRRLPVADLASCLIHPLARILAGRGEQGFSRSPSLQNIPAAAGGGASSSATSDVPAAAGRRLSAGMGTISRPPARGVPVGSAGLSSSPSGQELLHHSYTGSADLVSPMSSGLLHLARRGSAANLARLGNDVAAGSAVAAAPTAHPGASPSLSRVQSSNTLSGFGVDASTRGGMVAVLPFAACRALIAVAAQTTAAFGIFVPTLVKALTRQGFRDAEFEALLMEFGVVAYPAAPSPPVPAPGGPGMLSTPGARGRHLRNASISDLHSVQSALSLQDLDSSSSRAPKGSANAAGGGGTVSSASGAMRVHVNAKLLSQVWEVGRRSTKEDWEEWIQSLGFALFSESGSPALRACRLLAEVYAPISRELFNAAFLSCWTELDTTDQTELACALDAALSAETLPPHALQMLLSLVEFMEHDEKPLPIDIGRLASMACRCGAHAKALHYKEAEYQQDPSAAVSGADGLISIYDSLGQRESAVGALVDYERRFGVLVKEQWYEKLQRWEDALVAYDGPLDASASGSALSPQGVGGQDVRGFGGDPSANSNQLPQLSTWDRTRGRLRCLNQLGQWRRMDAEVAVAWAEADGDTRARSQLAQEGAASVAFDLGRWDAFAERIAYVPLNTFTGAFYRALLSIHNGQHERATTLISEARRELDAGLTARVGEGYPRAYVQVLDAQLLVEMGESVEFLKRPSPYAKRRLAETWARRLAGCREDHFTWYRTLMVRSMVLTAEENQSSWLHFASICHNVGRLPMASEALRRLLPPPPSELDVERDVSQWDPGYVMPRVSPDVGYAFLKHLWVAGRRVDAYRALDLTAPAIVRLRARYGGRLPARHFLKLSKWARQLREDTASSGVDPSALSGSGVNVSPERELGFVRTATRLAPDWYKGWHVFASLSAEAAETAGALRRRTNAGAEGLPRSPHAPHLSTSGFNNLSGSLNVGRMEVSRSMKSHIIDAVQSFFRAISFGGRTRLQDVLKLLTLWFRYGGVSDVNTVLVEGFNSTEPEVWLNVVPQMIARLHAPSKPVRDGVKALLIRIGRAHPQALVYPLTVAAKSQHRVRSAAAAEVLMAMRIHSERLVEQAELVSRELIRVAILWHELWHEGLEEASRLCFGEHNRDGMLEVVEPLHNMMEQGPVTAREVAFAREFGRDLAEAAEWCRRFRASKRQADLNQAWDLYYHVFKRINRKLTSMTTLELRSVSPNLLAASSLELAVPGTYSATNARPGGGGVVTIEGFAPTLTVISSKQRPRRLVMYGSDGLEHTFLLKGHEDMRQDERVMQLFGLVNELLRQSAETASQDVLIKRFSVIPLSPNSGLIGWVPRCDTLHKLVREYRERRNCLLNVEHRLLMQMAPDYDHLPLLHKVEVFEWALSNTTGADIARVLWLKSRNAEMWLDRRTNFTRSLATMSMVGYLLGLGDRHPSNLMLERASGKVLHIDFGDCFEVAQKREKFPERVPFRLTRMLVNAMEVCGVDGYFRHTAEAVMTVMRYNKASLMVMLEAFVHDPLINWRLLTDAAAVPDPLPRNSRAPMLDHDGGTSVLAAAATDAFNPAVSASSFSVRFAAGGSSLSDMASRERAAAAAAAAATTTGGNDGGAGDSAYAGVDGEPEELGEPGLVAGMSLSQSVRRDLQRAAAPDGSTQFVQALNQAVNRQAVAAIQRVSNKLTGRDFEYNHVHDVPAQVERLIQQAVDPERLCIAYSGWCGWW